MNINFTFYLLLINIIISPLYVVRWKIFGMPTTLLELSIFATIIVWVISNLSKGQLRTIARLIITDRLFWPIVVLISSGIVSLVVTNDLRGGLGILKAYLVEPVILYFIARQIVNNQNRNFFFLAFQVVIVWLAIIAFIQFTTGKLAFFAPSEITQGRVSAVFNNANAVGLYLGPILAITIAAIFSNKGIFKITSLITAVIALSTIYLTKSQGAYLAVFVSLAGILTVWVLQTKINYLALKRLIISSFVALILLGGLLPALTLFLPELTPAIVTENYQGVNTYQIRNYLWRGTFDLLSDHPLLGAGLNGFKNLYFRDYRLPQYHEALQYPHNFYFTFWAELGLLGIIGLLMILLKLIDFIFNRKKINLGLYGFLTYILVHGIVDVPYFKNDLSLEFWLITALFLI